MLGERIQTILNEAGVVIKTTKRSVVCDCPECGGSFKLYILKTTGQNKCMKCGERKSPAALVSVLTGISYAEAKGLIYEGAPVDLSKDLVVDFSVDNEEEDLTQVEAVEQLKAHRIDPLFVDPIGTPGEEYLRSRGITDKALIKRHDIRYSATMHAVVFIIKDQHGVPVGTQARFINPLNPNLRMITSEGLEKGKVLYNYRASDCEDAVITTEGPFDCLKCDVPGHTSVATLGKGISPHQIDMLLKCKAKRVYIALDRDAAKEASDLAMALVEHKLVYRMLPPEHRQDFGDCTQEEVLESIKLATPYSVDKTSNLEVFFE